MRRASRNTTARPAPAGTRVKPSAAAPKVAGKSWPAVGRKGGSAISSEGVAGQNAETHRQRVGPRTDSSGRSAGTAESATARGSTAAASRRRSRVWARAGRCVGTAIGALRADRVLPRQGHPLGVAVDSAAQAAVVSAGGEAVAAVAGGDERRDSPAVQKDRRSTRCRKQDRARGCR